MDSSNLGPPFLILIGIIGGSSVLYGIWQDFMKLNGGLSIVLGVLALIASIGTVASGVQLRRICRSKTDADLLIPSVTSIALGITMIVGAPPVFRPWELTGFAEGVSNILMYSLIVIGVIFTALGYFWYKDKNHRSPIGALVGFLATLSVYSISEGLGFVTPGAIILGGLTVFIFSIIIVPKLIVPEFTADTQ